MDGKGLVHYAATNHGKQAEFQIYKDLHGRLMCVDVEVDSIGVVQAPLLKFRVK
jgi:hypothetical protein